MLTHENIWQAIDRLAQSCGYSTSGLAKKAGLDPTAFNRSKRIGPDGKPRWPSTESLARILEATGAHLTEFIALVNTPESGEDVRPRILVLSYTQATRSASFDESGNPVGESWDYIHFPYAEQHDRKFFALELSDDTLSPFFRAGDRLILAPDATVRKGDRVVVRTSRGDILIREVLRLTAGKVELRAFSATHDNMTLPMDDIVWMTRIIWISQ